jgi:hypothetical protein
MIKRPDEPIGFEQKFFETSIEPVKRGAENWAPERVAAALNGPHFAGR